MIDRMLPMENSLIARVKKIILQSTAEDGRSSFNLSTIIETDCGKMLRTAMASGILGDSPERLLPGIDYVCAAVELIHTASLFHDDVIDGATLRRGKPALWKMFSPSGAILWGDILYCKSIMLLIESEGSIHLKSFTEKVHEVCIAEAEQELFTRGGLCDPETSLRIARNKTGPLFAVIGRACGYGDEALVDALEEAGYRIGTAYQLADDLIDELGDDSSAGKTLGTDRLRKKYTLAHHGESAHNSIRETINALCNSAVRLLDQWPDRQAGLAWYLDEILLPACDLPLQDDSLLPTDNTAMFTDYIRSIR